MIIPCMCGDFCPLKLMRVIEDPAYDELCVDICEIECVNFEGVHRTMMSDKREFVDLWNSIYDEEGFVEVMNRVSDELEYGKVTVANGLFRVSTKGWSDDEHIVHSLTSVFCKMSKHFVGYACGGVYYFNPNAEYEKPEIVIMRRVVDDILGLIDEKIDELLCECDCCNCMGVDALLRLKRDVRSNFE